MTVPLRARPLLVSLTAMLICLSIGAGEGIAQMRRMITRARPDVLPNVLLIIADDLGVDKLGVYDEGSNVPSTPTIDSLAANGVLFRNAWAHPVCSPTRAAIVTGRYAFRTTVGSVGDDLLLEETTFAEAIAPYGYTSAIIGKWHLGNDGGTTSPNQQGWVLHSGTFGGGVGRSYYNWTETVNGETARVQEYATTRTVRETEEWIRSQIGPWVVNLSLNAPHTPFHSPPDELHTYDLNGLDPDSDPIPFYNASIQALDTEIGQLLQRLEGYLDDTLIVFVGDNGTPGRVVEAPFSSSKGSMYEGGVNVPLILSGPLVENPGRETEDLVHVRDLFATIVELASIGSFSNPSIPAESVSLRPYVTNTATKPVHETVYTEQFANHDPETGTSAIRDRRYKYILDHETGVEELFDLWLDPFEASNLLDGALNSEELRNLLELRNELIAIRSS